MHPGWQVRQASIYDPAHNRDLDARLETVARELDPTRYVHRNSGTGDGHVYPGWYVGHWRDFQDTPGAPFVTEYGAQGLPVRQNVQRMLPQFGPDAGYAELVRFKTWLDSLKKISATTKTLIKFGTYFWNLTERKHWKSIQAWMKGLGIKIERSAYKNIPPLEKTPEELLHAREVWETWRFHDFQPAETFDNGIALGRLTGRIYRQQPGIPEFSNSICHRMLPARKIHQGHRPHPIRFQRPLARSDLVGGGLLENSQASL